MSPVFMAECVKGDGELSKIKGVILDLDGTLVDSNDAHAHAWIEAMGEAGYDVPYERVRSLIGMGGDNLLPSAINVDKDSEAGQGLAKRRQEIFKSKYLPHIRAFPGVKALVEQLRERSLKVAVASSGEQEEVEHLLSVAGVQALIEHQTTSADVENSKPDPDVLVAALGKLQLAPDEVLMLGDTPYDVQAAAKIGVGVIALRSGGFSDGDLQGAVAIYDDPAALLRQYDRSPLNSAGGSA